MKTCRTMLVLAVLLLVCCIIMLGSMSPWFMVAAVVALCIAHAKKGYARLTTLGSARWADASDLSRAGMLGGTSGLILGRLSAGPKKLLPALWKLFDKRIDDTNACKDFLAVFGRSEQVMVSLSNAVHTAIFAPTGVGKGVSCVIPFLQRCPDSCVVVDFKGELANLTAKHRRDVFGHKIVLLDPFKVVTQTPDRFNVLDSIDKASPLAIDDCRALAEAFVIRTGQEKDPHFVDSAEAWIASMLAVVVHFGEPGDRSLQTVRTLLSNSAKMEAVIELMRGSPEVWNGMLARMGNQLTYFKDRELGSTLTTTNRFLRFLDTLPIVENTKDSSFEPAELRKGKLTVYLVLPPEHMRAQSPLLRMWISGLLRSVVRGGLQEANKVHFVLDEAASLGHLDCLDDAVDKFRGYGVRLQFYYQSLGQLKKCFPEDQDQTLLSNTSQVFFGVNDPQTAEYVSARLGEETIVVDSGGSGSGKSVQVPGATPGSTSHSENWNSGWQQQARKLLKPEEVAALSPRVAITFTPGIPPLWTTLVRYYEEQVRTPGRLDGLRAKARIVAGCVAVLLAAILMTVCVVKVKEQHGSPYRSSGSSVQR
ncbi:MAG: type IV secretory system conjugative DNA transfer family protein [Planctomycetes bacterium]|nr:type IV secretory system conjugative DNA transfer family protein [Planctomycetota bacterium]